MNLFISNSIIFSLAWTLTHVDTPFLFLGSGTCLDVKTDSVSVCDVADDVVLNIIDVTVGLNSPNDISNHEIDFYNEFYDNLAYECEIMIVVPMTFSLLCYSSRSNPVTIDYEMCCVKVPPCVKWYDPFDAG